MAVQEQQEPAPLKPGGAGLLSFHLRQMPVVPDRSLQRAWARLLACRGAALSRVDRSPEAVQAVRQAVAISAGLVCEDRLFVPLPASPGSPWAFLPTLCRQQDPGPLYDLACYLALASTLPGEKGSPDLAEQAVQALRCAVASGFDNLHWLRTNPAFEPLRKRDDFQHLVGDLGANGPGRQDAPRNR